MKKIEPIRILYPFHRLLTHAHRQEIGGVFLRVAEPTRSRTRSRYLLCSHCASQPHCVSLGSGANRVRIPRLKLDKLACQAQGVGIFAIRRNSRQSTFIFSEKSAMTSHRTFFFIFLFSCPRSRTYRESGARRERPPHRQDKTVYPRG